MIEMEMPEIVKTENEKFEWREKYEIVLRSDRWVKFIRPMMLERAGGKCERCGSVTGLQVHHLSYANLGSETLLDLLLLCERCHEIADRYRETMAFGAWLKSDGAKVRRSPVAVPLPGVDPFDAVKLVESVRIAGGKIVLSWNETRRNERIPDSEHVFIELFGRSFTVWKDTSRNSRESPLFGRYEEIAAEINRVQ